MSMPEINVVGDVGASFQVDGTFTVADAGHLADFTKMMLTEESFDWVISGSNLTGVSFVWLCVQAGLAYKLSIKCRQLESMSQASHLTRRR